MNTLEFGNFLWVTGTNSKFVVHQQLLLHIATEEKRSGDCCSKKNPIRFLAKKWCWKFTSTCGSKWIGTAAVERRMIGLHVCQITSCCARWTENCEKVNITHFSTHRVFPFTSGWNKFVWGPMTSAPVGMQSYCQHILINVYITSSIEKLGKVMAGCGMFLFETVQHLLDPELPALGKFI